MSLSQCVIRFIFETYLHHLCLFRRIPDKKNKKKKKKKKKKKAKTFIQYRLPITFIIKIITNSTIQATLSSTMMSCKQCRRRRCTRSRR